MPFSGFDEGELYSLTVKILSSNSLHILICVFGGFCCFLPLMVDTRSYFEESAFRDALTTGRSFRDSSIASLALSLPLAIDIIIDVINSSMYNRKTRRELHRTCLNNAEKLILLLGINSVPIMALLPYDTHNLAMIFACCHKCRLVVVSGTIMISLCRYDKFFWSVSGTIIFLLCSIIAEVFSLFVSNWIVGDRDNPLYRSMGYASEVFSYSPIVFLLFCNVRWLLVVVYGRCKAPRQVSGHHRLSDNCLSFATIWVAATIFGILFLSIIEGFNGSIDCINGNTLLLNNIIFTGFELTITIFLMRMIKSDGVEGLCALVDSKKSYVRYISHELRTPLNTAFLGLKLLSDDLKSSRNSADVGRCETLIDVNLSCKAALDILNDLLCFDKLESGILEVHKQKIYIIPFVSNCVAMFNVQAREIGVHLTFASPTCSPDITDARNLFYPIHNRETVSVDKFKMDQVIRNLISNALKFTLRGGSVTVSVAFQPTPCVEEEEEELSKFKFSARMGGTSSICSNYSSNRVHSVEGDVESGGSSMGEESNFCSGQLEISVLDTGAGISAENQKRLFKDVVQFNPEILQAGGGSGLGLWITKGIVDLHSGDITVHSAGEGLGSIFTVKIPMCRADDYYGEVTDTPIATGLERTERTERIESTSRSHSGNMVHLMDRSVSRTRSDDLMPPDIPHQSFHMTALTVDSGLSDDSSSGKGSVPDATQAGPCYDLLIVDDSYLNRKMLCKVLRGVGHHCEEAEDGLVAIDKVRQRMLLADSGISKTYDAILMDFIMPNMCGPQATTIILDQGFQGPIFGVTGNALEADVLHYMQCGAVKVFTKPLDFSLLEVSLKDIIHKTEVLTSLSFVETV